MNINLWPKKCSGFGCYGHYSPYATDMDLGLAGQQKIRNLQTFKSNTVKVVVNKMAAHCKLAGEAVSVSTKKLTAIVNLQGKQYLYQQKN